MSSNYYIVDMDGTLVFTDELNNKSYNTILIKNNFEPISNNKRITRNTLMSVYPGINEQQLMDMVNEKQNYFIENIKHVQKNNFLFDMLSQIEKEKCVLWTAADKNRTKSIVDEFRLHEFFSKIIRTDKRNISADIEHICSELFCNKGQLLVFENDIAIVEELKRQYVSSFLFVHPDSADYFV